MLYQHKMNGPYEKYFKRPMDFLCAVIAVMVFWWLYVIIAVLVWINIGTPILFKQERPGMNEIPFRLLKFRTMTDERDGNGNVLSDEMRLTKFGKWLRSTSLDELPEVFNIIKGDMSIIGPRPLLMRYLPRYNDFQRRRHEVRPGLSGYAQVNGRNRLSWEEKFQMDVQYVDNITFIGDLKIIAQTVLKAFIKREGISSATSATMEEFMGNKNKTNVNKQKQG